MELLEPTFDFKFQIVIKKNKFDILNYKTASISSGGYADNIWAIEIKKKCSQIDRTPNESEPASLKPKSKLFHHNIHR